MTRVFSPLWNPITSTQTRRVSETFKGLPVYEHWSKRIAGKFVVVKSPNDWATFDTLEQAQAAVL